MSKQGGEVELPSTRSFFCPYCRIAMTCDGVGHKVETGTRVPAQPAGSLSVRVLIAIDEDGQVRECVVLSDRRQADELYHRLRGIWGGANVAMASRAIDALPANLHEKIPETTEILQ